MSPRQPSPRPGQQQPGLRIGDAERERAAGELAQHYAVGRLTQDEHAERLDRIWAARTHAELDPVFFDLPGHAPAVGPPPAAPRGGGRRRSGPPTLLVVLAVLLVGLAVVTNLPLVLVGLGVWFFFLRGGCGSRSTWGHPRRW